MPLFSSLARCAVLLAGLCASFAAPAQLVPFPPAPMVKLALNPATNKVYVLDESGNSVRVLNANTGVTTTIAVGPRPQYIAVNPVTNRIYVNNAGNSTITVIDGATDANLTPTPLNLGSHGPIAINPRTNIIYIVRLTGPGSDEVTFLHGDTQNWYSIATESFQPIAMAVNPVTNTIYVAHYATGDVRVIGGGYDGEGFPPTFSIGTWSKPVAVAVNPVTNRIYVLTEDSRGPINIIDGATRQSVYPLPSSGHGVAPKAIAVNPVTNRIYAAFANEVIVINGATNAYTYIPVATGSGPVELAVDTATNRIYVANASGTLTVIDGATNTTSTVAIPAGANSLGVNPLTGTAYVYGDTLTAVAGSGTAQANPLVTTISTLPGDRSGPSATFTLNASSGFAPNRMPIRGVYWQLDGQGAWTAATGSGPWTVSLSGLADGPHTLRAYAADGLDAPLHSGAQSPVVGTVAAYAFTAGSDSATVSLASSGNPSAQGQPVTFTASVAGNNGTPTGTIEFRDGTATIGGCAAVALASGAAGCTTSALAAGSRSITARYSGDTRYGAVVSAPFAQTVNASPVAATVTLASSANPSTAGSSVTFTATVSGSAGTATGTIAFKDAGTELPGCGAVALSGGVATCQATALAAGSHPITAAYGGNGTYSPATSATLTQAVNTSTATITLGSSQNPAAVGAQVTFTANVSGGSGAPTGTVAFFDGSTAIAGCDARPLATGSASCQTSSLSQGSHSITARYAGDSRYAAVTSSALSQVVSSPRVTPGVALASSENPSVAGGSVTFNANVSGSAGIPTGSVAFTDGGVALPGCGAVALASGRASCRAASLSAGSHGIVASYSGDSTYTAAASPPFTQTVNAALASASVALGSSQNPATAGMQVTFTATASGSAGTPAGTVAFLDGGTAIAGCESRALASGAATCQTSALAAGSHSIVARYSGSPSYGAASSAALTQVIQSTPPPGNPQLTLSRASIAFGDQSMGTTSPSETVTLTNTGSGTLVIGSISMPAQFAQINDCGSLAPGQACTLEVSFAPQPAPGPVNSSVQVAGTVSIATNSASSPGSLQVSGTAEKSLVSHFYRSILGRAPDAAGDSFWSSEAARMASLGSNVNETWFAMATFFYFSPEYLTLARNDAAFVEDLYETFFNRPADDSGLAFWTQRLGAGMPREVVLVSFMFSPEFAGFTQAVFGSTAARAEVDMVLDFYRGVLSRLPDDGGFANYVGILRQAQCNGAAAVSERVDAISASFLGSPEYGDRRRSNAQYVGDMYNTFLRRGGDAAGVQYWIDQLASGARTREQVRQSFIASGEFRQRVDRIVAQGCMS